MVDKFKKKNVKLNKLDSANTRLFSKSHLTITILPLGAHNCENPTTTVSLAKNFRKANLLVRKSARIVTNGT